MKLAPIGPKSVQMSCNLLVLELVQKLIERVHQTDFVISHQWIEFILVTAAQKWHLQSPQMLVPTEMLLMMSLFKHVPWVKWFEKHAQYSNF